MIKDNKAQRYVRILKKIINAIEGNNLAVNTIDNNGFVFCDFSYTSDVKKIVSIVPSYIHRDSYLVPMGLFDIVDSNGENARSHTLPKDMTELLLVLYASMEKDVLMASASPKHAMRFMPIHIDEWVKKAEAFIASQEQFDPRLSLDRNNFKRRIKYAYKVYKKYVGKVPPRFQNIEGNDKNIADIAEQIMKKAAPMIASSNPIAQCLLFLDSYIHDIFYPQPVCGAYVPHNKADNVIRLLGSIHYKWLRTVISESVFNDVEKLLLEIATESYYSVSNKKQRDRAEKIFLLISEDMTKNTGACELFSPADLTIALRQINKVLTLKRYVEKIRYGTSTPVRSALLHVLDMFYDMIEELKPS